MGGLEAKLGLVEVGVACDCTAAPPVEGSLGSIFGANLEDKTSSNLGLIFCHVWIS